MRGGAIGPDDTLRHAAELIDRAEGYRPLRAEPTPSTTDVVVGPGAFWPKWAKSHAEDALLTHRAERLERGLGRSVSRGASVQHRAETGPDINDATPALAHHLWYDSIRERQGCCRVNVNKEAPPIRGDLPEFERAPPTVRPDRGASTPENHHGVVAEPALGGRCATRCGRNFRGQCEPRQSVLAELGYPEGVGEEHRAIAELPQHHPAVKRQEPLR
jgi:hypothetical protein